MQDRNTLAAGSETLKFQFYILSATYYENGLWIDFSSCPRKFEKRYIAAVVANAVGLNEVIYIEVFGFEEDK